MKSISDFPGHLSLTFEQAENFEADLSALARLESGGYLSGLGMQHCRALIYQSIEKSIARVKP